MKAWRKHNSSSYVRKHPAQKLTRNQARTHFQAEVSEPSQLLYGMFLMIGLPTPSEFRDWFMKGLEDYKAGQMNELSGTHTGRISSLDPV